MKYLSFFFFLLISNAAISQNITEVIFHVKKDFSGAQIQGIPEQYKAQVIASKNEEIFTRYMYFTAEGSVWYESDKTEDEKNTQMLMNVKGLNPTKEITNSSVIRIHKNFKTNSCQIIEGSKVVPASFLDISWKITDETKIILGYKCYKAEAMLKSKPIYVYFTKEIKGRATQGLMPEIDGVVLEFNSGSSSGIAVKVLFNQPEIKDFFVK